MVSQLLHPPYRHALKNDQTWVGILFSLTLTLRYYIFTVYIYTYSLWKVSVNVSLTLDDV